MQTLQVIHSYSSPLAEQGLVAGAGISPDSSLSVAGNGFGLHVWDNASGQLIGIIEGTLPQGNVVFSSDQRLVSVSSKYGPFSVWGVPAE
jgi:WD40 repeat protein